MGAFHAYDIRGIWNKDFNKDDVYKMGFFIPSLLNTDKILVGRDCRVSSPDIHEALTKGLCDAGAEVYDLGLSSTPMVYYATAKHRFNASVQITASHNPAEYNGLKISCAGAMPVGYDTGLKDLEYNIKHKEVILTKPQGTIRNFDIRKEYLNFMKSYIGDFSELNIAMDLSNGMSVLLAKELFGNFNTTFINDTLDGRFPNHEPNPLIPANTIQIRDLVKSIKADIGIVYDGDADRVMFIDNNGAFISPDLIIAALGNYFLKRKGEKLPAKVLQDIRSSKAVGEYLSKMGGEINTWKVGRAYAAPKLKEIDGLFGGELAGHYYFKDFFYSDSGILASILMLNVLVEEKRKGGTLSKLIGEIKGYDNSGEINFRIERKQEAMDTLKEFFSKQEEVSAFYDFDGYRIEFEHWWFNVRPSNTEPYLRFIAEADTTDLLNCRLGQMRELFKDFGTEVK